MTGVPEPIPPAATTGKITTRQTALDKQGMTLDEIALFVQSAMRAGHSGSTHVKVNATFLRGVKALEIGS